MILNCNVARLISTLGIFRCFFIVGRSWFSVGAKLRYMGYFASLLHPPGRKSWLLFSVKDMSWGLKTHVLLSFLWSIFCKWPVINVTPQTLKKAVHKTQD